MNSKSILNQQIEEDITKPIEEAKGEDVVPIVNECSANYTNDTESVVEQPDGKVMSLTNFDAMSLNSLSSQLPQMLGLGDFWYDQIMTAFYSNYCGCTLESLNYALFNSQYMYGYGYGYPQMWNQTSENLDMTNLNELKGTMYENYVVYSKNDINLQLLKGFKYETDTRRTPTGRPQTVYICGHEDCRKEFLRTCNLLDHMRMHEGIKPNNCEYCGKGFTQKSNLRKHLKVHLAPELQDRKRYTCEE